MSWSYLLIGVFLAFAPAAVALEVPLSFDDAIAITDGDAELVERREAERILRAAQEAEPFLDANPQVGLIVGARVLPTTELGFEGQFNLSQSLSLAGTTAKRRDALQTHAAWIHAEADVVRLTRRLGTARAWLELWAAERSLTVVAENRANEERLLGLVERLVGAGELSAADAVAANVRVEEERLHEKAAEGDVAHARSQLGEQIALKAGRSATTAGPAPDVAIPSAEEAAALKDRVPSLPRVNVHLSRARHEVAGAKEDAASRGLRLNVGVQAYRDALGATLAQGTLGIPIPLFDLGRREAAARNAEFRVAEGEAAAAARRERAEISRIIHEISHTEEVFVALRDRLVPIANQAVRMREQRLAQGEGTLLDVIEARRSANHARTALIEATRERAWARIELATLAQSVRSQP